MKIICIEDIEDSYPATIVASEVLRKVRFFIGDRWIEIGRIEVETVKEDNKEITNVTFPDVDFFMLRREDLNDGSADWACWGTRLN